MSKSIETLQLSRLLVASHYEYHRSSLVLMTAATPEALMIVDLLPRYKAELETLFQLVNRAQGSVVSQQISDTDKERDGLLGELFTVIDFAAGSQLTTRRDAGVQLKRVIAPYRGIAQNEYTKETGQIRGLLRDLGADDLAPAIDTLTLGAIIQQLRQANNRMASYMETRSTEMGTRAATLNVNTDQQRHIVDEVYREIVQKVNAVALLQPTAAVEGYIDQQNGLVMQYKHVIANLKPGGTGSEKRKKGEEEDSESVES